MPERVKKLRDFFGMPRREDFSSVGDFVRSPAATWVLILIFAAAVALITTFSWQRVPKGMEEGMIATRDIKADRNYEIIDEEATDKLRQDALQSVLPVYNFDAGVARSVADRIHQAFDAARGKGTRESFSQILGVQVSPEHFAALTKDNFSSRAEQILAAIVMGRLSQPVIAEKGMLAGERERGIVLRHMKPEGEQVTIVAENTLADPSLIPSTAEIREKVAKTALPREKFRASDTSAAIVSLAEALTQPNVSFDNIETDQRRESATANVQDVILKVKAGEMIIRNGSRFEARHLKILGGIRKETGSGAYPIEFLGTILFVILFLVAIFYFAEKYVRRFHPTKRDYFLMSVLVLVNLLVMRIGFALAPVLHDALLYQLPTASLYYAIPVAGSAMLIRMFLHAEDSFLFAVFVSVLASLFSESDLTFVTFCLLSNIAGITAIANADKRSTIIKAGAITGLVGAVAILALKLLGTVTIATQTSMTDVIWHMICAFFGGISSAILVMVVAPLIESLMDYTTDIKLLELANLNHPLLRELIVRAPGTYHHSHMVGILAEAAAEAIGANPLLVRVGAYYHDIGKIRKPLYFVENSKEGEDRHAKLLPHMSALIISSHVKEGIEMAEEAHLPRSIIDMIPQHHGTRAISFFYDKAKAMQSGDENINEADFHYPGPKPQTREAAILMLADVSEAAVRSLKEKSTTRIQQTVQRVINDCFADEQLDECELTLKDLNEIAKAFAHILFGLYHQRIEYPKEARPEPEVNVVDEETLLEDQPPKPSPKAAGTARGRKTGA